MSARILYFSPGYFHAREDLFMHLSREFDIKFIEASAYMNGTPSEDYRRCVNYEIWKYNHFRLQLLKKKYIIPLFFSIYRELRKGRYDLVISSTQHPLYAKYLYLLRPFFHFKLAYVNEVWNYSYNAKGTFAKWYENLSMYLVRHADFVLNEGTRAYDFITSAGVDPEKCYPWIVTNPELEHLFSIGGKDIVRYAYVGRLTEAKGVRTLLRAYESLPIDYQNRAMLYIIGRGPLEKELVELQSRYATLKVISWIDSKYLPYVYKKLDFFVLASHFDGFSTVSCEAASMGVPLILSENVGCIPDLLGQSLSGGFVVPVDDSQVLAEKISLMIDMPSVTRKNLGQSVRERYQKFASVDVNVDTLMRITQNE